MKNLLLLFSIAFVFSACEKGKSATEKSLSKTDSADWKPVDSAVATKAWMEYATPGDLHKMLAKYDGNWAGTSTMWMEAGGKPVTNPSECTNKMIFGGRYQQSNYKGNFMGMPFEGMSLMGYDNARKKFVSTWIDNMGTGIMHAEGEWNAAKKSLEFKGTMADPARPGKECNFREVYVFTDDNNHTMEMYGPDSKTGKEYKSMEIKFTRKK
ncbi:DUF1579 domain-containing protein [Chryseobacterium carnipullorum]|uniref:DUF1579 domain-containing protein n=1 Tax=Chryseobacterium carnipullorum TaxID=1124835 RepID=A0A376EPT3_CHRCU|nr:DUF1579 domain-containing protein [Chryseobacterium carnipullorum]AZA47879.1 DUF1579 domain-containing protein [Chryseobacterium carnipullorum]AZA67200.1 DUF1579 domain-containing protein [Chryseobacterium carnipullorum]STD12543.1 Protein of uncharacterised function (DUF1579) [Chryseobacterium carnipullorum]